jgi:hypothetical protein
VVDQLLEDRRNGEIRTTTVRYLIGAIRGDTNPGRFLPVPDLQPARELIATMNPLNPNPFNPPKGTTEQCDSSTHRDEQL